MHHCPDVINTPFNNAATIQMGNPNDDSFEIKDHFFVTPIGVLRFYT